jgi:hypothetical protein
MEIIYVVIVLLVVGAILYVIEKYAPIDRLIKAIIYFIVIIAVLLWVLRYLGLMSGVHDLKP